MLYCGRRRMARSAPLRGTDDRRSRRASVEMIRKLVGFDTTSRNSNLELIAFVEDYLHGLGIATQRVLNRTAPRPTLAHRRPRRPPRHHAVGPYRRGTRRRPGLDLRSVRPAPRRRPPLRRGTADMKSFIAVVLAHAPEWRRASCTFRSTSAFSYDEEIGCIGVRR